MPRRGSPPPLGEHFDRLVFGRLSQPAAGPDEEDPAALLAGVGLVVVVPLRPGQVDERELRKELPVGEPQVKMADGV